jgi:hypothetical protein
MPRRANDVNPQTIDDLRLTIDDLQEAAALVSIVNRQ